MPELYLLDAETFAAIAKGRSTVARHRLIEIVEEMGAVPCLTAATEAKVRYAMERLRPASDARRAMERLLDHFEILPFDSRAAAAQVRVLMQTEDLGLGAMELMTAAQAIASDAVLVTHNPKLTAIEAIEEIEDWTDDL